MRCGCLVCRLVTQSRFARAPGVLGADRPGSGINGRASVILAVVALVLPDRLTVDHRILCIEVEEKGEILAVGTGGEDGVAHRRWVAAEVRRAIGQGDRFYVISPNTGWEAELELLDGLLAGAQDDVGLDCLRGLRPCRWR